MTIGHAQTHTVLDVITSRVDEVQHASFKKLFVVLVTILKCLMKMLRSAVDSPLWEQNAVDARRMI